MSQTKELKRRKKQELKRKEQEAKAQARKALTETMAKVFPFTSKTPVFSVSNAPPEFMRRMSNAHYRLHNMSLNALLTTDRYFKVWLALGRRELPEVFMEGSTDYRPLNHSSPRRWGTSGSDT